MTDTHDPYRRKGKVTQHAYRDGFIVWNWTLRKWEYFNEALE